MWKCGFILTLLCCYKLFHNITLWLHRSQRTELFSSAAVDCNQTPTVVSKHGLIRLTNTIAVQFKAPHADQDQQCYCNVCRLCWRSASAFKMWSEAVYEAEIHDWDWICHPSRLVWAGLIYPLKWQHYQSLVGANGCHLLGWEKSTESLKNKHKQETNEKCSQCVRSSVRHSKCGVGGG